MLPYLALHKLAIAVGLLSPKVILMLHPPGEAQRGARGGSNRGVGCRPSCAQRTAAPGQAHRWPCPATCTPAAPLQEGRGRANTALAAHAGRLLALHEGDLPYALRIACNGLLDTVQRVTFE